MRLILVLLCLVFCSSASFAADWETANNGLTGYTVEDILIDPVNPNLLYCSCKNGVYRTVNGGASWYSSSSGLDTRAPSCAKLCIDPNNNNRIYVQATDSNGCRYVYRSDNAGINWAIKSSGITHPWIRSVTASKTTPGVVFCGTIIGGDHGGCYKSTNYGDTWTHIAGDDVPGSGLENDCAPVVVDPTNDSIVYCGRTYYTGFLRSTDGGAHWTWTDVSYKVIGIAVIPVPDPNNPGQYLPSRIIACGEGHLKVSTNAGVTFTDKIQNVVFSAVAAAPSNSSIVYATSPSNGIYKSTDMGNTWNHVSGSEIYGFGRIAIHPTNPDTFFVVVPGRGVAKSTDGGHTFAFLNTGLPTEINVSFLDNQLGTGVTYAQVNYVGLYRTFDEGASWQFMSSIPYFPKGLVCCKYYPSVLHYVAYPNDRIMRSMDGGFTWEPIPSPPGGDSYYQCIAVDPRNYNHVIVGGYPSNKVWVTRDGGATWLCTLTLTPTPDWWNTYVWNATFDPTNSNRVYLSTYSHPYRSNDGGSTWTALTNLHYSVLYGVPATPHDTSDVRSITIDTQSPNIIYACTQWGGAWKSTNYGDTWTRIFGPTIETTNNIIVDSRDHNTLYMSSLGYSSTYQGIYKSTNAGATWTSISSGLMGNDMFPNMVVQSLSSPDRFYVGGQAYGCYRSPGGTRGLSIDQAKALTDGAYCMLSDNPVVALKYTDGTGCIETENRLRGVRAVNIGSFVPGDKLQATGTIHREADADAYMQIDKATLIQHINAPKALSMNVKSLYDCMWSGPSGITSRVWGVVTETLPDENVCFVDDGSGARDPWGRSGVKVKFLTGSLPAVGSFVTLEGILTTSTFEGRITVPCLAIYGPWGILSQDGVE